MRENNGSSSASRPATASPPSVVTSSRRSGTMQAALGITSQAMETISSVAAIPQMRELNIGHFLMGESLFVGLDAAIGRMRDLMNTARNP